MRSIRIATVEISGVTAQEVSGGDGRDKGETGEPRRRMFGQWWLLM